MTKEKEVLECGVDCTLCRGAAFPRMPVDGDLSSKVLFVGEAPGADEDQIGKPFMGRAGKLLKATLVAAGVEKYALINVCRCRPPDNRLPTKKEIETCLPYVLKIISEMPNLKLVVPLGNTALQALTGMKSITKVSGKLFPYGTINILPIYHPAYILRNQKEFKTFAEHVSRILPAIDQVLVADDFGAYQILRTKQEWKELLDLIRRKGFFIYDTETNGLNPFAEDFIMKCIGFALEPRAAWVLPMVEDWIDEEILSDLRVLFGSKRIGKVGHNLKFDNKVIQETLGVVVRGSLWDTAIVAHLLNENTGHGLKEIAWSISRCGGYERALSNTPDKVEGEELYHYNAIDCDMTSRLYHLQKDNPEFDEGLHFLNKNLILPVSDVLAKMECRGIRIDVTKLKDCSEAAEKKVTSLLEEIHKEASVKAYEESVEVEFNPNSHVQLREVLFKFEGLEPVKVTEKTGSPSTDRETLDTLAEESNLCRLLSEYSLYQALQSKTLEEIKHYITKYNRIHTTFSLDVTTTGRSSSFDPNLQNVVKGKKDVVGVRRVFVPDDDYVFAEYDMNQWELRCMAEEAGDMALVEALNGDVHRLTAAAVLGKDPKDITSDERSKIGKVINFSLIYRISAYGLAKRLKCSEDVAKKYIQRFFQKYYRTLEWMKKAEDFVKKHHYIKSRTGRYRRFPVWDELNDKLIREAVNMPIQGLAGDVLLYSLIEVDKFLVKEKLKSFIVLEIHDSILLNIHKEEKEILPVIKYIMENNFKQYMPFETQAKVDLKIGTNWLEMEEVK